LWTSWARRPLGANGIELEGRLAGFAVCRAIDNAHHAPGVQTDVSDIGVVVGADDAEDPRAEQGAHQKQNGVKHNSFEEKPIHDRFSHNSNILRNSI
jgi:hypothetical protein